MNAPLKLGVSRCLLGERVRYDGDHRLDRFLTDTLGRYVVWVPVCPEMECGLGVPREAMRLTGTCQAPRLVTLFSGQDHTQKMTAWAQQRIAALEADDLSGFIFKSRSPSCGVKGVKIYPGKGLRARKGQGLFAAMFRAHFPRIPVEEDEGLHVLQRRDNFLERVFTLKRWREALSGEKTLETLLAFHGTHGMLVRSHSGKHFRHMEKLLAEGKQKPVEELLGPYEALLLEALSLKATPAKHIRVLQRMTAYLKNRLKPWERQVLREAVNRYKKGLLPLSVPVFLIKSYALKYGEADLADQVYLRSKPYGIEAKK